MALEALTSYFTAKNQKAPAQAPEVNVGQAQGQALQANLDNMPLIQSLLSRGNQFNQAQNNALLEQAVGGYGDWSKQMGQNAQAYAQGTISPEQQANLTRLAAEHGISTGRAGQAGQFSLLRDLGIDQYKANQASGNIMQSLVGMSKVNPMSPLSFMASTQDALGVAENNRQAKQAWLNADQASKNVRSNAFWAGLAAGDATFQQASGYGQGGGNAGGGGGGGGMDSMMKMFGSKGGGLKDRNNDYNGDQVSPSDSMDFSGGGMSDMGGSMGGMGE